MVELAPKIKQRVLTEILSRSWSFILPQLPLILLFFLFAPWLFAENSLFTLGAFSTALGTIVYSLPLLFNQIERINTTKETFLLAGSFLVGLGWGVILTAIYSTDGMLSQTTLLTMIIICGVHAGTYVLFHIHSPLLLCYLIPAAGLPTLYSIFIINNIQELSLFLLVIIYNLFLISTAPIIRNRYLQSLSHEHQIIEERDKVAGLMNAFPGIVSLVDDQLHYRLMNSYGHKLFNNINVINQPVGFMNDDNQFGKLVYEFHQGDKATQSSEFQLSTPQGKHWALVNLSKLNHPENWIVIATIFIDDLVKARLELAQEKLKSDSTARLASLGEMAQGIAHEINNPLSVVLFSAEELNQRAQKKDFDPEFFENFTEKILRMSQRMAKIVKGLRYFSRDAENDPIKPTSLSFILEQAIDMRSERFKNNKIQFTLHPFDESLIVNCREVQMVQVIINLLNNAHDATMKRESRWINVFVSEQSDTVVIKIENSGDVIPKELAEKIFEPFFSTKEVNKGSGLGLSISIGLMQQNGGDLKLVSLDPVAFEMIIPKAVEEN